MEKVIADATGEDLAARKAGNEYLHRLRVAVTNGAPFEIHEEKFEGGRNAVIKLSAKPPVEEPEAAEEEVKSFEEASQPDDTVEDITEFQEKVDDAVSGANEEGTAPVPTPVDPPEGETETEG